MKDLHELQYEDDNPLAKFTDEELTKELRSRRLTHPGYGKLSIDTQGKVNLDIDQLEWPVGNFKVQITCLSDLTMLKKTEEESNG